MNSPRFKSIMWGTAAVLVLLALCIKAVSFYSQQVFYYNENTYRLAAENGDQRRYESHHGPAFVAAGSGLERTVTVDGIKAAITALPKNTNTPPKLLDGSYRVVYPGGKSLSLEISNGIPLAYHADGTLESPVRVTFNDGQMPPGTPVWERYPPVTLVIAAFPEFHERPGQPVYFVLGLLALAVGWGLFRYERIQRLSYWISLQWIGTDDPEPSYFHFFMSKVTGIFLMLSSLYLFFKAFDLI